MAGTAERSVEAGGLFLGRADGKAAGIGGVAAAGSVHDVQRRLLHAAAAGRGQRLRGGVRARSAYGAGPGRGDRAGVLSC